jgi:hypothetical protein
MWDKRDGSMEGHIYMLKFIINCLENVGASMSHNFMGLHGLFQG